MEELIKAAVGLHIIGIAALLGGFLTQLAPMRSGTVRFGPPMLYGALTMLVTGVTLIGLSQADGYALNTVKYGIKLAVLVVILGLVYVKRDDDRIDRRLFGAVGGLTVINIFIALLWT
jgi:hypothetical protein